MDKVVSKPLKIDFHIHSYYSKYKDELELVKDSNEQNIEILLNNLKQNQINMCSITDHDYFSYELYTQLKAHEGENYLVKVFPGVEFSIGFNDGENKVKPIHVICIFDDEDNDKVKTIASCIPFKNNKIDYDSDKQFFTEERFISILKEIDLNVILIAHQKSSVKSNSANKSKNDVSSLGSVKFNELISCEYFESFEFKNMRNGIFNRKFAIEKNKDYDQIRFITGSDCHDWKVYPKHDSNENDNVGFNFTYLKCLPCFRGLAMSFSDTSRISTNDNLFSKRATALNSISLSIDNQKIDIPLSQGINVIIGDNSVGKSLLLHKMTNYMYLNKSKIQEGYEEYLTRNKIKIDTVIEPQMIHTFDYQGLIREKFSNDVQDNSEFLADKFPADLNSEIYKQIILTEFQKLYSAIENNFEYNSTYRKLNVLTMYDEEISSKNLSVKKIGRCSKSSINRNKYLADYYKGIITKINEKYALVFDNEEKKTIDEFLTMLSKYASKYECQQIYETRIYNVKTAINLGISTFNNENKSWKSDLENCKSKFDNEDLNNVLKRVLKDSTTIDTTTITENSLKTIIAKNRGDSDDNVMDLFKSKIEAIVNDDLVSIPAITEAGEDVYTKLSNGMNSTIYFDILSTDNREGIYIVDQPEDDVSQTSIGKNVIKDFKEISKNRQVILITHNPQFVVNLDVDNVICLAKEKRKIVVRTGALEYSDEQSNVDILQTVAQNLDGGIDSIRKRWKRYEKAVDTREAR